MTLQTVREDSAQVLGPSSERTVTPVTDIVDEAERIDLPPRHRAREASSSNDPSIQAQARKPTYFGFRRFVVADWRELSPGDAVVLVGSGNERVSGTVYAITKDGAMVWLIQDNGAGRKLFHISDNYQTLMDPKVF